MIELDKYARLYRLFMELEEAPLKGIISEYKRLADITIRMADFFEALLEPKCVVPRSLSEGEANWGVWKLFLAHIYL